ncbi:adenylate/guanylate cyclase domain-containing protein [Ruegeria sp. SCPT10]|uniref:adenylate/guanylate cyclase domain-containing protein n=1 Tax=Ruegeria sp. SCP10 TaxID=3141377 RepID=UPI003335D21C
MAQDTPPSEIAELLGKAEQDAEQIVGLLRMLVAFGLGVFFLVTVQPVQNTGHAVLERQWVSALGTMFAYFALGLVTWTVARQQRFAGWMAWPVSAADALFLVFNVWVGMRNVGLSGDVIFVLPAVWLVPVVLAFGVLRGNPKVMALQVALLVLGLLYLIGQDAGLSRGQDTNPIWLFLSPPPNLIRLFMITLAGVVLIVAAYRVNALLFQSVTEAQRRANLTRYLPAQVVGDLGESGLSALKQGRRQLAGVIFIDLRGFTTLSQNLQPEQVSELITSYRSRVSKVVRQENGIIDKFIGDAVMIVFEGHRAAERCLRCGLGLSHEMRDWSIERRHADLPTLETGIGLHWGEVFVGVIGDQERLEYSVFGDTVNIAARLESLTRSADMALIMSSALIDAAGASVSDTELISLPPVEVRGRSGALDVYGIPRRDCSA